MCRAAIGESREQDQTAASASLTQPKPGWHTWTTPTGRSYTQEPWRYTA